MVQGIPGRREGSTCTGRCIPTREVPGHIPGGIPTYPGIYQEGYTLRLGRRRIYQGRRKEGVPGRMYQGGISSPTVKRVRESLQEP